MDIAKFIEKANNALKTAIVRAAELAASRSHTLHLAHVVLVALDLEKVHGRLKREVIEAARQKLSQQLQVFPISSERELTADFDLAGLLAQCISVAENYGSSTVTPLTLLTVCVGQGVFADPSSKQTQEILCSAGDSLLDLVQPGAIHRRTSHTCPWDLVRTLQRWLGRAYGRRAR